MESRKIDKQDYEHIMESDIPDVQKLLQSFESILVQVIGHTEAEIEIARAMQDEDARIKEQIKMETVKFTRGILRHSYLRITGRKDWDE